MDSLTCLRKHIEFTGIATRHLVKELIRPRWNGIKTLVLAQCCLNSCKKFCQKDTSSILFYPALILFGLSSLVVHTEISRYSVRINRMYELFFALDEL